MEICTGCVVMMVPVRRYFVLTLRHLWLEVEKFGVWLWSCQDLVTEVHSAFSEHEDPSHLGWK